MEIPLTERLVYFQPHLPGIPEDLLLARDRGEVLFMTGAGVSTPAPSSLPGFGGLVVEIFRRLDVRLAQAMDEFRASSESPDNWSLFSRDLDEKQQTELKRFAAGEFDVVLGMLERRMSRDPSVTTRMRLAAAEVLSVAKIPNSLHLSLNKLGRRFGSPFIATTNFDNLHERAARNDRTLRSFGLSGLPRPSRSNGFNGIFHIHGFLEEAGGPEIVLTDQDFGDAYLRRRIVSDFIYDAIRIYSLVIIGYSGNDPPFRYLLNAVAGDSLHYPDLKKRYAIVPRRAGDVTVAEDWRGRFIEPVCYDDANGHIQLQELMSEWAKSVPTDGVDKWAEKTLRNICTGSPNLLHEYGHSLFGYIFKRANSAGRVSLGAYLGAIGASTQWLTIANKIIRELQRS